MALMENVSPLFPPSSLLGSFLSPLFFLADYRLPALVQPGSALRVGVRETRMSPPRLPRGNSTPWGCRSKLEHLIGACSLTSRELFDLQPAISGYYPPPAEKTCRGWSPTALCCNHRLLLFPDNNSVDGMTTPVISLPDISSWRNEE